MVGAGQLTTGIVLGHVEMQLVARPGVACQHTGQRAPLLLTLQQQIGHGIPLGHARQRAALQARQGQQVLHHRLHAASLLRHEGQVARTLVTRELQGLQGFDKTGEHRERCADFVRHVGYKITPHGLSLLHRRHIPCNQQLAALTIGVEMHRQAHRA